MHKGISTLGICHPRFPVDLLCQLFKEKNKAVFSWLDLFFNPENSANIRTILRLPVPKYYRVHIINGPGMNNRRTQPHEITYKMDHKQAERAILRGNRVFLKKFEQRVKHIYLVSKEDKDSLIKVSPWLEHQPLNPRAFAILADIVRDKFGPVPIVDNPVRGPFIQPEKYWTERHGTKVSSDTDIADLDGVDFRKVDLVEYAKETAHCNTSYIHGPEMNGLGAQWQPPHLRRNWPEREDFELYRKWMR